jgi:hypothetical protein
MHMTLRYWLRNRRSYRTSFIVYLIFEVVWNGNDCAKIRTSRQSSLKKIMVGQTQQDSVGHFKYFGSKTNYAL